MSQKWHENIAKHALKDAKSHQMFAQNVCKVRDWPAYVVENQLEMAEKQRKVRAGSSVV